MSRFASCILALLGLCVALAGGCRPAGNHAAVQGQVLLDDQPLAEGSILFTPIEGTPGPPTGGPITAGQYRLQGIQGPSPGANSVQIQALRPSGKQMPNPFQPNGPPIEVREGAVPARFNTATQLRADIQPGENVANFAVESK